MAGGDLAEERAAVDLLRRRVLNVVGHELRTPVTTLRGLAEALGTTGDPAAEAELHEALKRTARRTEALLDDLLLAAGYTTAMPAGVPEPTPVAETARAAWADVGGDPDALAVDGDGLALAPGGALRRALAALLDNARRYGSAPVEVKVADEGADVVVVITDRGPGVSASELPLLDELFFRGEQAVLTHHSLGLGLSVVRALSSGLRLRNLDGAGFAAEVRFPRVGP